MLVCSTAQAKFAGDLGIAGEVLDLYDADAVERVDAKLLAPANKVQNGLQVDSRIDVSNGVDYHLIGVASLVQVNGLNISAHRDAIAVQGTVIKNSSDAHVVGLKCGIYDAIAGGSSTCLTIDYPLPLSGTPTAGITFQGSSFADGLLGVEFLNPQSYKHSINLNGSKIAMGSKNGSVYCLQFNPDTAGLDYLKDCGTPQESVHGVVQIGSAPSAPPPVVTPDLTQEQRDYVRQKFMYPHPFYNY